MELKLYEQLEFESRMHAYNEGKFASLKDAFPLLSPRAIEFINNGTLPEEWDSNE